MQPADEHGVVLLRRITGTDVIEIDHTVDGVQSFARVTAAKKLLGVDFVGEHVPISLEDRRKHDEALIRIERSEAHVEILCQRAAVMPFISECRMRYEQIETSDPTRGKPLLAHPLRQQKVWDEIAGRIRDVETFRPQLNASRLAPEPGVSREQPRTRYAGLRDDAKAHAADAVFAKRPLAVRRRQDADIVAPLYPRARELERDLGVAAHRAWRRDHRGGDRDALQGEARRSARRTSASAIVSMQSTASDSACSAANKRAGL